MSTVSKLLFVVLTALALKATATNADPFGQDSTFVGKLCFYNLDFELPKLSKVCPGHTVTLERHENTIRLLRHSTNGSQTSQNYSVAAHTSMFEYLLKLEKFLEICADDAVCNSHQAKLDLQQLASKDLSYLKMNATHEFLGQTFEHASENEPTLHRSDIVYDQQNAVLIDSFSTLRHGTYVFFSAAELKSSASVD